MTGTWAFKPVPHDEAVAWIKGKPAVQREVFDRLLPEIRARVFTVTGVRNFDTLQRVRDRIAELPAGGDWEEVKGKIAAELEKDLGAEEAERRAELLLRLHGNQAYAASAHELMRDQEENFPYWQYLTMEDDRVRDSHRALHGIVARADSEFWMKHYPPWQWGCRCLAVPMQEGDVEAMRAAEKGKPIEERMVIEGAALDRLNQGDLVRGPNQIVDVRTPSERGTPGGYEWEPGTLKMPLSALRGRYDEDVWEQFEAWAKKTKLADGQGTVMDWLGAAKGEAAAPADAVSAAWEELGLAKDRWGKADAKRLIDQIREKAPGADKLRAALREAISGLPPEMAAALPPRPMDLVRSPEKLAALRNRDPALVEAVLRELVRKLSK